MSDKNTLQGQPHTDGLDVRLSLWSVDEIAGSVSPALSGVRKVFIAVC